MKNETSPVVSIVLCSFNQAEFLEHALESLTQQTYSAVEIIVMDGGSTDGSKEIIERYSSEIYFCHIGPDGGPSAALNSGFEHSTGKYLAYLNSDDVLLPNAARQWVENFDKTSADVLYGDINFVDENGDPSRMPGRWVSCFKASPFNIDRMAAGGCTIPQQATAWKREAFDAVGGFNPENRSCWDGEFFVDLAIAGFKFSLIPEVLAEFRIHSESISGSGQQANSSLLCRQDRKRIANKWKSAGYSGSSLNRFTLQQSGRLRRLFRYIQR